MKISHENGPKDAASGAMSLAFPIACLAALALVLAAYSNSLDNAFHFDDYHVIEENVYIRDLANVPRFFTDARTFSSIPTNATYRPIVSLTLALDYARGHGLAPRAFHVSQIALLSIVGVMLFASFVTILDRVAQSRRNRWIALIAAAWFCVHTGNTQPINYISARSELLAAIGILGSLLIFARWPAGRRFQLHLVPIAFGALAKTPAVIAAPLLLAYTLLVEQRLSLVEMFTKRGWPRVRSALISTAPAFVFAAALYLFVESMNPAGQTYGGGGRLRYLMTQAWVWVHYARLFVLPTGLSADTDLELFASPWDPRVAAGALFAIALLGLVWWTSRRDSTRIAAFGIAWFAIGLVPSSTILPLAEVANDHRVFFPFMGLSIATVSAIAVLVARASAVRTRAWLPGVAALLALAVLAAHAIGTYRRNRDWRTEETLWADVVRKSPGNGRGWMNYGLTRMAEGRYEEAKRLFERAHALLPSYSTLEVNLGIVESRLGNLEVADRHFTRAIELNPDHPATHRYYARWLLDRGRGPEAQAHLERTLELAPADIEARHALMDVLAARGAPELDPLARETLALASGDSIARAYVQGVARTDPNRRDASAWYRVGLEFTEEERHLEATRAYRTAIAIDATHADAWNNLGWSLGKLGFFEDAVAALVQAKERQPGDWLVASNLAWAAGHVADSRYQRAVALQRTGHAAEAVALYDALLERDPSWVNAHYNRGHALMTLGRHGEAIDEFRAALALQPDLGEAHLHVANCLAALGRTEEADREQERYRLSRSARTAGVTPGSAGAAAPALNR